MSGMEKSFSALEALVAGATDLHYKVAKNVADIINSPDYKTKQAESAKRLDVLLERLLPGMSKSSLCEMFTRFPQKSEWRVMGVDGVRKATREAIEKDAKERANSNGKENNQGGKGRDVKENPVSELVEDITKPTNPNNLGGGWGGLSKDNVIALLAENEKLKQDVATLNAKLVEVMFDRDQLRAELARTKK